MCDTHLAEVLVRVMVYQVQLAPCAVLKDSPRVSGSPS